MSSVKLETRPSRYASEAMRLRRARILVAARELLAEDGAKFTMRDLARRSGVALATLYNTFESQDALTSEAVVEIFEQRIDQLVPSETESIFGMLEERAKLVADEILRVPAYAKRMTTIYFGAETQSPIRDVLHSQPFAVHQSTLRRFRDEGALADWVNIEAMANELTANQYAVVSRWGAGEFEDQELANRSLYSLLAALAGMLVGTRRAQCERLLMKLKPKRG